MASIRNLSWKLYKIEFSKNLDFQNFLQSNYEITRKQEEYNQVTLKVEDAELKKFINDLSKYNVKFFREVKYDLEKYFKDVLENKGGVKSND